MSDATARLERAAPWLVFAAAAVLYAITLRGEFVYDDFPFIVQNPAIHTLARPWKFLLEREAMSEGGFYTIFRPLASWCFSLVWAIAPNRPAPFHLLNLVAHGVAGVCVWRLATAIGLRRGGGALWAGLLFVAHPVQTEAVAWIAGLSNPLFAIGVTCACVAWLRWRVVGAPASAFGAVVGWYVFALLGKEHAAALPLLLLGLEWALPAANRRPLRDRALGLAALVVVTVAYVAWRSHVLGRTGQIGYVGGSMWATVLTTTTVGFVTYLRLLVWPANLHPEYVVPIRIGLAAPGVAASMLVLAVLAGGAVAVRRRVPVLALGAAWWLLALAPVSNVIPMKTIINERLLYLPFVGFAFAVGAVWDALPQRAVRVAFVAQLVALAALTVARNRDWLTSERLWTAAVAAEPRGYTSHFNLGHVYRQRGDSDGALREFARAIELRRTFPHAYGAVGEVRLERGEYREAVHAFRRGLREAPGNAALRAGLIGALVQWGDAERVAGRSTVAEGAYLEALRLDAQNGAARAGLAALGREPDA